MWCGSHDALTICRKAMYMAEGEWGAVCVCVMNKIGAGWIHTVCTTHTHTPPLYRTNERCIRVQIDMEWMYVNADDSMFSLEWNGVHNKYICSIYGGSELLWLWGVMKWFSLCSGITAVALRVWLKEEHNDGVCVCVCLCTSMHCKYCVCDVNSVPEHLVVVVVWGRWCDGTKRNDQNHENSEHSTRQRQYLQHATSICKTPWTEEMNVVY